LEVLLSEVLASCARASAAPTTTTSPSKTNTVLQSRISPLPFLEGNHEFGARMYA
jgi:hypothetical protein